MGVEERAAARIGECRRNHAMAARKRPTCTEKDEPPHLRHGRAGVSVSTLANQWYCELKTHLSLEYPEIKSVSAALEVGIKAHKEASADAMPATREEILEKIRHGDEFYLRESLFRATLDEVPIAGIPDVIHLRGRRCGLLLEFKFSSHKRLFLSYFVQAQLYGLLLEANDLDVGKLKCAVAVVHVPMDASEKRERLQIVQQKGLLADILAGCRKVAGRMRSPRGFRNAIAEQGHGWTYHVFSFDYATAVERLRDALAYWRGHREPRPTTHLKKCCVCSYNAAGVCKEALTEPDPALRVRRRRRGHRTTIEVYARGVTRPGGRRRGK